MNNDTHTPNKADLSALSPLDGSVNYAPSCKDCKAWGRKYEHGQPEGFCGRHGFMTGQHEHCAEHSPNLSYDRPTQETVRPIQGPLVALVIGDWLDLF